MGKKGSWFSAIKRVFIHNSKEKQVNNELEKRSTKEKKKARGQRHGETKSFIPIFREPSSIEKILGEVDEQKLLIRPPTPFEHPKTPPLLTPGAASPKGASSKAVSPKATSAQVTSPRDAAATATAVRATSPRASSQRVASPKAATASSSSSSYLRDVHHQKEVISHRPEPTLRYRHLSATKIQAAYRGYMSRRSFRALRGLVRLQGVVRGQNVKRQTANAMKMMQLLVRVQSQIQARRVYMLENQALRRQQAYKMDKELASTPGKWASSQSEVGNQEEWDDSRLTKEEREARIHKRMEAVHKRERAMAYSYSSQSGKSNPKLAQASVRDVHLGRFPWWWNWLERQLPATNPPRESQTARTFHLTPGPNISPRPPSSHKPPDQTLFDNFEVMTPTSTRSMAPSRSKHFMPTPTHKTPPWHSPGTIKFPKTKTGRSTSAYETGLKDDDSLTSCPPFSVPNYMTSTVSAKAKARASSNPRERFPGTPGNDSKRRFSFPLTTNIGSFRWSRGVSDKDSRVPRKEVGKQLSMQSAAAAAAAAGGGGGDLSIDSAISMPAAVGRKPFNRFV